ncbi:Spy/CpxP family protein refolding chaperone [Rhodopseudomonas palustris]|uniref:Spy/CpxP family protein refolding chaperone n=1 Tax=Rhodopseudomonas palustris TaxID=1076 RepID=UPI002ACE4CB4|nr:Spy/CpxP family protein refolding chaperone [Rhodopseudomonas palustris]WQG99808.1 Spy/CpxP family protein refolding chaperone [Rhodopseudomonas palustris]
MIMRKTLIVLTTAALLTGGAVTGAAIARDRSDRAVRTELTESQMADKAAARAAQMKVDLRLTLDQDKHWAGFQAAIVEVWKTRAEQRASWRNARANQTEQPGKENLIDQIRKDGDAQIERGNLHKKLADAAQPLYESLDEQQKQRFAEALASRGRYRHSD